MGLKFQKMASAVRIYLENEHGDREELLDPGSEVELRSEKFVPTKRDVDSKKIRESVLSSWFRTASDRQKKLQTLVEEYNELVLAVNQGQEVTKS
ncbi:unnamed protein product [Hymenolepis diminuta]|uniref:Death domain-containing protein n=1 Tax=Hymenolepis diminuta TaxID=6216 RepID=A0A0R3SPC4_HYMDI|nr:unnamed protein product [Hymenolepis diminuta]VUZ52565.1 unnamed protein product [Hymenolepis diminuta]